ncbi:MAG: HDOD domain-containing protein [Terracidiphilus sp.]|jgi:EAL and modified HD-GYP domain-containing signal transduction protein
MALQEMAVNNSEASQPDTPGGLRYLARQPILDLRGRVHGYELLFRAGPEAAFRGDGEFATRTMLDNSVLFGMDKLTGGLPAFVNCTAEALTERLVDVLPPSMTVLEILETVDPTPQVVAACRKLKETGFRLALDDFSWSPKWAPLVELADYIKVDFMLLNAAGRGQLRHKLKDVAVALIAEKVETQEEYKQACKEGFTYFQGYYFCRPVLLKGRRIPANRLFHIQILELLQHNPMDLKQIGDLVKRDASLAYRLLRLVNSPVCAIRQEVRSIEAALVAVGEDAFRRIATVAIGSELNANRPPEILRMAFVRGRFCELAAGLCALDTTEQYLLGMFSLLPAMLEVSMEELAPALPLRQKIREALVGVLSRDGSLLMWAERHEHGDWLRCDAIAQSYGLNQKELVQCFEEAVIWAEAALQLAF